MKNIELVCTTKDNGKDIDNLFKSLKVSFNIHGEDVTIGFASAEKGEKSIELKLKGEVCRCKLSDIVYVSTDKRNGANTGNMCVFFKNRKYGVLVNFTSNTDFRRIWKLSDDEFVQISKSTYVNRDEIKYLNVKSKEIIVGVYDNEETTLKVSRKYLPGVLKIWHNMTD